MSRRQLYERGVTRGEVRANLRAGRWRKVGRQSIAVHCGPLPQSAVHRAAVNEAGPRAYLDGGSAHQLGRLVSGASPETTVVLWAREEDLMEVIDPVSDDSRRVSAPVLERLRSELNSSNVQRVEE